MASRALAPLHHRRWALAAAPLALLVPLSLPGLARAQVNVEGLRKALAVPGVHGSLNGSLTTYHGNTMGAELGGTGLVGYREERQLVYMSTSSNYSRMGGEPRVANAFAHLRYNYVFGPRTAAEVFTQVESDRFRRLRLRSLVGIGPRFTIFDGEGGALFYGVSYMYVHTTLASSVADRPVRPADVHRLNNYAALLLVLEPERATFGNTLYFQPRLDDFRDIQLLDVLSLDVTISGRLSVSLQATLRYETPVPAPIKRTDLAVKNLLGVTF
jgi:hypothetical protein